MVLTVVGKNLLLQKLCLVFLLKKQIKQMNGRNIVYKTFITVWLKEKENMLRYNRLCTCCPQEHGPQYLLFVDAMPMEDMKMRRLGLSLLPGQRHRAQLLFYVFSFSAAGHQGSRKNCTETNLSFILMLKISWSSGLSLTSAPDVSNRGWVLCLLLQRSHREKQFYQKLPG